MSFYAVKQNFQLLFTIISSTSRKEYTCTIPQSVYHMHERSAGLCTNEPRSLCRNQKALFPINDLANEHQLLWSHPD